MICADSNAQILATLPPPATCGPPARSFAGTPTRFRIQLYKTKIIEQSATARICTVITRVDYVTRFFFNHITQHHEQSTRRTTVADCDQMTKHQKCAVGRLHPIGDINATQNQPASTTPARWFGCCIEQVIPTTNCYVRTGPIYKIFNASTPQSTFGDVRHCSFHRGDNTCQLSDESVAQYTVERPAACIYKEWLTLDGLLSADGFVSEDHSYVFLLSPKLANPSYNCDNKKMWLTGDGIPYHAVTEPVPIATGSPATASTVKPPAVAPAPKTTTKATSVLTTAKSFARRSVSSIANSPTYNMYSLLRRYEDNKVSKDVVSKSRWPRNDKTVTAE
jgi:hypothetical protein